MALTSKNTSSYADMASLERGVSPGEDDGQQVRRVKNIGKGVGRVMNYTIKAGRERRGDRLICRKRRENSMEWRET